MSDAPFNPHVIELRDATATSLRDATLVVAEAVNWSVLPGEFWVIGGQQRSGKSDLLMLAAGLLHPMQGSCRLFGCATESLGEAQLAERLRTGFVFQGGQLFNRLTIAENVALPLRYQKNLTAAETARAVEILLETLELTPFADLTPINVAASWQTRAALARALILKPELLLLDNPLHGLSARHSQWMLRFLDQLWRGHSCLGGRPITLVTATDDFRPWQHSQRKFALLHEKKFTPLGGWTEIKTIDQTAIRELMAETEAIQN